ncbi:MAG: hypothetical protein M1401_18665 [Chloroflexi bacterium]|nr:hypothetical protein [Chloroflexota bacterium]MCL5110843.1 hypothetical protein [Chloroflexota bacterium]
MANRNRFTKSHPCPICGGYDQAPRGQGERCYGFLSDDSQYAHCTREDFAGSIPLAGNSQTYAHRLVGDCACGQRHDPNPPQQVKTTKLGPVVAVYDYHNEQGQLAHQTIRYGANGFQKTFRQRQPNGAGGWIWDLKGACVSPYRLPQLLSADLASVVFVCEGEKDADNLARLGEVATTNAMGAGKWREDYNQHFAGRHVVILPDNDQAGRDHARQVAENLYPVAAGVRLVELPNLPSRGDVSDWLSAGGTAEELRRLVGAAPLWTPTGPVPALATSAATLAEVVATFRRRLYLPDTGALEVVLGAYAANRLPGDPVWLVVVAPAGGGKTEKIAPIAGLPHAKMVGVLTEPSLLSGTSKRDQAAGAKGGLLKEIGAFGVLVVKDFGGIFSMHRDAVGPVVAALREVYDGSWSRFVGADGGKELSWQGKCGLIGAATPAIDAAHRIIAQLGERFIFYREDENRADRRAKTLKKLENVGEEQSMRAELGAAVVDFFSGVNFDRAPDPITTEENSWLADLADFITTCRSAVIRDTFSPGREIELIPGAESPTRLAGVLAQLLRGLLVIGIERGRAWELIRKVALDSMPQMRRQAIECLAKQEMACSTSEIGEALDYPTNTMRRTLEELNCFAVIERIGQGQGREHRWQLTEWAIKEYGKAATLPQIWRDGVCEESDAGGINSLNTVPEQIRGKVAKLTIPPRPIGSLATVSGQKHAITGARQDDDGEWVYTLNGLTGEWILDTPPDSEPEAADGPPVADASAATAAPSGLIDAKDYHPPTGKRTVAPERSRVQELIDTGLDRQEAIRRVLEESTVEVSVDERS